jgi:hypothetical protein
MNTKPPFLRFLRPSSPAPLLGLSAWALTFAAAGLPTSLSAQPPPVVQAQASSAADARLTPDQLDELLGPIALYPDALIALILPASATSSDVVLAARYLQGGGDASQLESQPWDDSVVALAHYPDVVAWMDQNLAWTQQLGTAFVVQPDEVMQSVQRLRAEARDAGTLVATPEQDVIVDGDTISIVPAQPDIIYVPRYDPEVVYYVPSGYRYPGPFITFGTGFSTGLWLTYDMDWGHRRIWVTDHHDRRYDWRGGRDWRHPVFPGRPGYVHDANRHPWNPPPNFRPPPRPPVRPSSPSSHGLFPRIAQPSPIRGAPPRPPGWSHNDHRPGPNNGPGPRVQAPNFATTRASTPQPPVAPLQGPVVPPLRGPVVEPFHPPQPATAGPEHRGPPDWRRDNNNDDDHDRGRRDFGRPSTPSPAPRVTPPAPPAPAARPGTPASQGMFPRLQPPTPPSPRQPSDDDDRGRDRGRGGDRGGDRDRDRRD